LNGIKRGVFWLTRRLLLGLQLCGGEEERFRLIFLGVFACIQCTCLNINLSTLSHLWVGLLKKRTIFAHVLVCISHVLAAEPRRFLAILLVKRDWDQKKTAVFPPYLKVVVACFVCVVERVGWTHHFGAFFCLSYVMCTKRFFDSLLVSSCTWGAHKPLRGMLHLAKYSGTVPNHCTWAVCVVIWIIFFWQWQLIILYCDTAILGSRFLHACSQIQVIGEGVGITKCGDRVRNSVRSL